MSQDDLWAGEDILEAFDEPRFELLEVRSGMTLTHTGSRFVGDVAGFSQGDRVVLIDDSGRREVFKAYDGAFVYQGVRVALRAPATPGDSIRRYTASGSVFSGDRRARVAGASRIWVEGIHDAELIEKIWGDDLREAAVVVEPLHGADDLAAAVADFRPGPKRRLGVLLDHLVSGSKESRIAAAVSDHNVLVCGHPYVDIWQAIAPVTIGISEWPFVPKGEPWKAGVLRALGMEVGSGEFWVGVLDAVSTYRDVETALVNAVEQLIDFVTITG